MPEVANRAKLTRKRERVTVEHVPTRRRHEVRTDEHPYALVLLLALLVGCSTPTPADPDPPAGPVHDVAAIASRIAEIEAQDAASRRGRHLLVRGELQEAYDELSRVVVAHPSWPRALVERATCAAELGRHADAIADLNAALRLGHPSSARVLELRAEAKAGLGDVEGALGDFATALDLEPRCATYLARGRFFAERELFVQAESDFEHALALAEDDFDRSSVLRSRASARQRLGKLAAASADMEEAIRLAPDDPYGYAELGLMLLDLERWLEAAAAFEAALEGLEIGEPSWSRIAELRAYAQRKHAESTM